MEKFDFIQDSDTKGKDGEIPYFDMESEPKIPFYKKKDFL